jgi:hypothetical protein
MVDRASQAEHQTAAVAAYHAREAMRLLEEMGLLRVPTILDATRADVHHMQLLGESWHDGVPLGQALKVTQRERARAAVRELREGGHREVDDVTVAE